MRVLVHRPHLVIRGERRRHLGAGGEEGRERLNPPPNAAQEDSKKRGAYGVVWGGKADSARRCYYVTTSTHIEHNTRVTVIYYIVLVFGQVSIHLYILFFTKSVEY